MSSIGIHGGGNPAGLVPGGAARAAGVPAGVPRRSGSGARAHYGA